MSSRQLSIKLGRGFYPERTVEDLSKLDRWFLDASGRLTAMLGGRPVRFERLIKRVNQYQDLFYLLSDEGLNQEILQLRQDFLARDPDFSLFCRTFALVREVADRSLGMRHFNVQLYGGYVLCRGMVAEMNTGEGKTLTATLPAVVGALLGLPVHVVTVNDYLARRDADWMRPVFEAFGLTVGIVVSGLGPAERQAAYRCSVTYCTNKELVFDYLKDRLAFGRKPAKSQVHLKKLVGADQATDRLLLRGLGMALVDEVDSILIDEARTPLIISGQGDSSYQAKIYQQALDLARQLSEGEHFTADQLQRRLILKDQGKARLAELVEPLSGFWKGKTRREELIRQSLTALHLFHLDRDYLIKDGRVQIVDEFTGRTMQDRSWEQGLHQLIEVKEDCEITSQKETLARISYQKFFRRYQFICGMTGTAREVGAELWSVYRLKVITVPPNKPVIRTQLPSRVVRTQDAKWQLILKHIRELNEQGRPILVGTRSVEASEVVSDKLHEAGLTHRVLNARQDQEEADIIAAAGQSAQITVATNMAGRGTDIKLSEAVRQAGGLHVIATERHSARRIDRQLFGRCGRQGDPGSCELIAALDDEILALYQDRWSGRLSRWLVSDRPRRKNLIGRMFANYCQRTTERRHFKMRRELLDLDDMMADALAFSGQGE